MLSYRFSRGVQVTKGSLPRGPVTCAGRRPSPALRRPSWVSRRCQWGRALRHWRALVTRRQPGAGGGRSAGGGGPVGGDPLLRLGQRHRPGADPPVQLVLDLVLRVRRRARLRPEVPLVAGSAAELQRDQMVFLVTPWAGVGVAVGGNLLALQRIGVG